MIVSPDLTGLSADMEELYFSIMNRCYKIEATGNAAGSYVPILSAILSFSNDRVTDTLPYIKTLAKKAKTNHNCKTCAGACAMQHDMSLVNIVASHHELEGKLNTLDNIIAENELEEPMPGMLMDLHRALYELIKLEKDQLIPLIREAKTKINAR